MSSLLFPVGAVVFGVMAIYAGVQIRRDTSQKSTWSTTQGKLLKRGIAPGSSAGGGPVYNADIQYSYTVDGKELTARQMFSGKGEGYDAGTMKNKVDALPDNPEVHYDPKNPAEAYLLLSASWQSLLALIFGALLTLVGGILTLSRLGGGGDK